MSDTIWTVYLLVSGRRTYIGATTNLDRRLRQHNGEIRGGARSTRGRQWIVACYIAGFPNRSEAYRWEKLLKSRCRGFTQRYEAFRELGFYGKCPMRNARSRVYMLPENHNLYFVMTMAQGEIADEY